MAFPTPSVQVAPHSIWGKTSTGTDAPIGITTPTAASQTLTFSGNAVAGETFSIGVNTYVWTSTASSISGQTPYFVLVGGSASASITNAAAAITGTASKGTLFSNNTNANPVVTAVATSSTVLTITAIVTGADGNGIPLTETMTNAVWGATTTTGGVSGAILTSASGSSEVASGTLSPHVMAASATLTIPIGAFDGGVMVLSGTATVGGVAIVGTWNFATKLVAAVDVVTASASTAQVYYFV